MAKYAGPEIKCIVSGSPNSELHHVKTRGAGGTDDAWNLMPVSSSLHRLIHSQGLKKVSDDFPQVRKWLVNNGWDLCPVTFKWRHE